MMESKNYEWKIKSSNLHEHISNTKQATTSNQNQMLVTIENIISFIPQKPPFVMIDQLISSDETSTRTGFQVRADNIFVEDGFLTEPALVENIAQTAAARA